MIKQLLISVGILGIIAGGVLWWSRRSQVMPVTKQDEVIYDQLARLKVGNKLPAEVMHNVGATQNNVDDGGVMYEIGSDNYSYQHVIVTDAENQIGYLQLIIPKDKQVEVRKEYEVMGEPETVVGLTKTEMLYGFPGKGVAFTVNEYGPKIVSIMKFPKRTLNEFLANEAKDYQDPKVAQVLIPVESTAPSSVNMIGVPWELSWYDWGTIMCLGLVGIGFIGVMGMKKRER